MDEQGVEAEIQAKGKTAPRITPEAIDDAILSRHFINAGVAVRAIDGDGAWEDAFPTTKESLPLLTICVLVLKNGFVVTGESACASPENYDEEIGQNIAYKNAREKIWALEGYQMRTRLALAGQQGQ